MVIFSVCELFSDDGNKVLHTAPLGTILAVSIKSLKSYNH